MITLGVEDEDVNNELKLALEYQKGRMNRMPALCTNSMAEATVQTLPVRNCVVCSIALQIHTCEALIMSVYRFGSRIPAMTRSKTSWRRFLEHLSQIIINSLPLLGGVHTS